MLLPRALRAFSAWIFRRTPAVPFTPSSSTDNDTWRDYKDRSATTDHVRAADRLIAAYNVMLTVVWGALLTRYNYAPLLFAAHATALAMPTLLARAGHRLSPVGRTLHDIYPFLWLIAFWTELDFVRPFHANAADGLIGALDRAVFGTHIDAIWIASMPNEWFSEVMHALYFAYYPALLLPLLFLLLARRSEALRDMAFGLSLTYLSCFLIYIAFPVDGPHFIAPAYQGSLNDGLFYQLVRGMQETGDSMGCAFPSSHVAGAVTMAYLGRRWLWRPAAALLVAAAVGVAFSCVYTQNHYAIDSLAGVVWALGLQMLIAPVLLARLGAGGGGAGAAAGAEEARVDKIRPNVQILNRR